MSATSTLTASQADEDTASAVPVRVRVLAFSPTGPDALAHAADVLPQMSTRLALSGDVHVALVEALRRLGGGAGGHHRLLLADETRDMFAAYLVLTGQARQQERDSAIVRGWVVLQDLTGVRAALVAAARFWRAELAAAVSSSEGDR